MSSWREYTKEWPCKQDCPNRQTCCHSKCEAYKEAKKKHDARKAMIRAKRGAENEATELAIVQMSKRTRKPLKQR